MNGDPEIVTSRTLSLGEFAKGEADSLISQLRFCWKNNLYFRLASFTNVHGAPMVRLDLAKQPFVPTEEL